MNRKSIGAGAHHLPSPRQIIVLLRKSVSAWSDDNASSMGAALAYYTLFSVAPLLLIVLAIVGLVFDQEAARGQIYEQLRGLMGAEGAAGIQALVASMSEPAAGLIGTVVGLGALAIGATTVFAELQTDLDKIWRAPAPPTSTGVWSLLRSRVLSFGMVLAIGFLLLISLVLNAAISAWGTWAAPPGWEAIGQAINFALSFAFITVAFALIYKFMPRVHVPWSDVWVGAALTSLLFTVGKLAIGLYIGKSGVASGLGAASSLVVLLVWVYYSAQIFLLGAELTWVYANELGSRSRRASTTAATSTSAVANVALGPVPVVARPAEAPRGARNVAGSLDDRIRRAEREVDLHDRSLRRQAQDLSVHARGAARHGGGALLLYGGLLLAAGAAYLRLTRRGARPVRR